MITDEFILHKAITLVEGGGSAVLSMRNLAREVNVTPMALYRHYANREALIKAVADHYFTKMALRWQSIATSNQYEQTLILIGADLVDFSLKHPYIYQLMFIEPHATARDLSDKSADNESPTFGILVVSVQQGITAGELGGAQAQEIALALAGQVHGLIALHQGGRLTMPASKFQTFCQDVVVRAIGAYKVDKKQRLP